MSNYSTATAAAFTHDANYEEFEEIVRIQPGNCMDGTFSNGMAHFNTLGNALVQRFDIEGNNVGNQQFPVGIYGMAADDEAGLIFAMESGNNQAIHVYEYPDGELGDEVGVINNHMQYHGNQLAYGLEWVAEHEDGPLWITHSIQNTA